MIKRGYTRTEIIKFVNQLEKELKRKISVNDVMEKLPELYQHLSNDIEKPIGACTYDQFKQMATIGIVMAQHPF